MDDKKKSIVHILTDVCAEMCDKYCKYPDMCECEDELMDEHCENCPLGMLIG